MFLLFFPWGISQECQVLIAVYTTRGEACAVSNPGLCEGSGSRQGSLKGANLSSALANLHACVDSCPQDV